MLLQQITIKKYSFSNSGVNGKFIIKMIVVTILIFVTFLIFAILGHFQILLIFLIFGIVRPRVPFGIVGIVRQKKGFVLGHRSPSRIVVQDRRQGSVIVRLTDHSDTWTRRMAISSLKKVPFFQILLMVF